MRKSSQAMNTPRPSVDEDEERRYGVARLTAFSDAVFAFAITLLIVNILPAADFGSAPNAERLFQRLFSPPFLLAVFSYVLSFCIIGMSWYRHYWVFRHIVRIDARLIWLNLALLLFIVFLPFPTNLLGKYGNTSVVAAFYAVVLVMVNLLQLLLWWYASSHHRLIRPALQQQMIAYLRLRMLLPVPVLLVSVGLAFISPYLAEATWVATIFISPLAMKKD